jgi:protein-S-isoprenylcysteine O-methyltransferase Ste14
VKLTDAEVRHFKNVLWGTRFWAYFRWVLLAILGYTAIAHFSGWSRLSRPDWLAAGGAYLLVAWPGLCRTYVFHTLHRLVAQDPEARAQLAAAGVKGFHSGAAEHA